MTQSPLLRFLRNADIRTAAFFSSAALFIAGLWVGFRFELWNQYFLEFDLGVCPASLSCVAGEPIGGEVATFVLLSLGGVVALVGATLLVLRGGTKRGRR